MITKMFEIRDAGTFIPVIATLMDPIGVPEPERYLLRRAGFGYGSGLVWMSKIQSHPETATYSVWDWNPDTRTMPVAHRYIKEHWDELESGAVVDIEFILGLRPTPKVSEAEEVPI